MPSLWGSSAARVSSVDAPSTMMYSSSNRCVLTTDATASAMVASALNATVMIPPHFAAPVEDPAVQSWSNAQVAYGASMRT